MKANDLSQFTFKLISSGAYRVFYHTKRGDYWIARVEDMTLIDETKNEEWARRRDIIALRDVVKRTGVHVHADGTIS